MKRRPSGFSLVEILIVISIISLLLQLAVPAVLMSREAARKTVCQNNLRQIGLACQSHISANGNLPTGGWGFSWAGDPDRGNDSRQPGGWIYNILPYLEESALHGLGAGENVTSKKASAATVCRTPLEILICPSRRRAGIYPFSNFSTFPMRNTNVLEMVAKTDYAANAGDHFSQGREGPKSLLEGDSPDYPWYDHDVPSHDSSQSTGVIYQRSEVGARQITDGMTKTYLVGEKYLNPSHYIDGMDGGDDQTMYGGADEDNLRWTVNNENQLIPPGQDSVEGKQSRYEFGSPHISNCNMVFCDGSVRAISYSIDSEIHKAMSNRADEKVH